MKTLTIIFFTSLILFVAYIISTYFNLLNLSTKVDATIFTILGATCVYSGVVIMAAYTAEDGIFGNKNN